VAERAVACLTGLDLDGVAAGELSSLVERFQHLRCRLEAAEASVLSRWDAAKAYRLDGAKTAAAWLGWKHNLPAETARQRVRHARALRNLPALQEAWAGGEIDRSHITTLLGARNGRTAEAFDRDHKVLLDAAKGLGFRDFKSFRDRWMGTVDPDGAERNADNQEAAREAYLAQSIDGMWFGRITLDPVRGTIVNETLMMIERKLFEIDWAQAKDHLGRKPTLDDLPRTPAQRRADALTEMAIRARTAPRGGRRPAPLFTVVIDYETLKGPVCELWNRTNITPGTAAKWLTAADVERIVFDGKSRVIDVGAQRRFFRGADRRALQLENRTCWHPTCDEIPQRPQVDHIHEWSKGGTTIRINGRWGCNFHNEERNQQARNDTSDADADFDSDS
ncbi:MAG TPA: DUF222 domain-containing protein, partial [Acidimicrobiales bacterium]